MTFEEKVDEVYGILSTIAWGREQQYVTPDYGQPRGDGHPKLVYRLIEPRLEQEITHTNVFPRIEVVYESIDEDNWFKDMDRIRRAFRNQEIEVFSPTSDLDDEGKQIYHRLVIVVG